jgi:hypothetical protein
MQSKIYKGEWKAGLLDNKVFIHRDYFQYYTTGIEDLIPNYPDLFDYTRRETGERPDVIMHSMFQDMNLGDMFVALNNQTYLWGTPFSLDDYVDAVEFRMNYVRYLMRDRIEEIQGPDGEITYNNVGRIMQEKIENKISHEDEIARLVIVPKKEYVTNVERKIKQYLESRVVQ